MDNVANYTAQDLRAQRATLLAECPMSEVELRLRGCERALGQEDQETLNRVSEIDWHLEGCEDESKDAVTTAITPRQEFIHVKVTFQAIGVAEALAEHELEQRLQSVFVSDVVHTVLFRVIPDTMYSKNRLRLSLLVDVTAVKSGRYAFAEELLDAATRMVTELSPRLRALESSMEAVASS